MCRYLVSQEKQVEQHALKGEIVRRAFITSSDTRNGCAPIYKGLISFALHDRVKSPGNDNITFYFHFAFLK